MQDAANEREEADQRGEGGGGAERGDEWDGETVTGEMTRGAGAKSSVWMLMAYFASDFSASLMPSATPTPAGRALSAAAASFSL